MTNQFARALLERRRQEKEAIATTTHLRNSECATGARLRQCPRTELRRTDFTRLLSVLHGQLLLLARARARTYKLMQMTTFVNLKLNSVDASFYFLFNFNYLSLK